MMKCSGIMDQKPKNVNKFWVLSRDEVIGSGIPENEKRSDLLLTVS